MTALAELHLQERGPSSTLLPRNIHSSGLVSVLFCCWNSYSSTPSAWSEDSLKKLATSTLGQGCASQRRKQGPEYASLCDWHKQTDSSEVELSPLYILGKRSAKRLGDSLMTKSQSVARLGQEASFCVLSLVPISHPVIPESSAVSSCVCTSWSLLLA